MSFTGRNSAFDNTAIGNDGFFPAFTLGVFNDQARIDPSYSQALVVAALNRAVSDINQELAAEKLVWQNGGSATLANIPVQNAVTLYQRAVFCTAKGELLKEYQTLTRKKEAENTARESDDTELHYLTERNKALALLRGETPVRCTVALL